MPTTCGDVMMAKCFVKTLHEGMQALLDFKESLITLFSISDVSFMKFSFAVTNDTLMY